MLVQLRPAKSLQDSAEKFDTGTGEYESVLSAPLSEQWHRRQSLIFLKKNEQSHHSKS